VRGKHKRGDAVNAKSDSGWIHSCFSGRGASSSPDGMEAGYCYFANLAQCIEFASTVGAAGFMQVLIRKSGTSLYWTATGRWTRSREQASDLGEVCRAVLVCVHRGLTDAELVIRFEQLSGEMTVPVASLPAAEPARVCQSSGKLRRTLSRLVTALPFRRRKIITYGCRRNTGPGGYGRR
jgi:hypothetical protein